MHFAQTLDASIIPEWKSRYVDFAQGKKFIAKLERSLPDDEQTSPRDSENQSSAPNSSLHTAPNTAPISGNASGEHRPNEPHHWELPPPAVPIRDRAQAQNTASNESAVQDSSPSGHNTGSITRRSSVRISNAGTPLPNIPEGISVSPRSRGPYGTPVAGSAGPLASAGATPAATPAGGANASANASTSANAAPSSATGSSPSASKSGGAPKSDDQKSSSPYNSVLNRFRKHRSPSVSSRLYRTPPASARIPQLLIADPLEDIEEPQNVKHLRRIVEGLFYEWLNGEVNRADQFFTEMLEVSKDKMALLERQLECFEHHRTIHHEERDALKHPHATSRANLLLERVDWPSLPKKLQFWRSEGDRTSNSARDSTGGTTGQRAHRLREIGALNPHQTRVEQSRILRTTAHTSDFSNRGDIVGYYQAKSMLKTALSEFYHSLKQVKGFQQLNMTAIRKIAKKFDKQICDKREWKHTEDKYLDEISTLKICYGVAPVDKMIQEVEDLYAAHFTQGNHKHAIDSLNITTLGEQEQHPGALFIAGVALGAAIPLGVLALYGSLHSRHRRQYVSDFDSTQTSQYIQTSSSVSGGGDTISGSSAHWIEGESKPRASPSQDSGVIARSLELMESMAMPVVSLAARSPKIHYPDETTYLLQILGGFTCVAVCLVGFTGCLYVWSHFKINYSFILELDRTSMMAPPQFFSYAAAYAFLLALMGYLTFNTFQPFHRYYPILLLGISVLVLIWPFGKTKSSRAWLLHSLWRLTFSGLYPVEFRDLLVGDIFCSLTYSLSNMEIFFCVYAATAKWWTIDGALHAQRCTSSHSRSLGFLNCLPGIWRFMQCWRRYGDTLDWFPHLLNAGKYTFNILYNMSLSLARISPETPGLKALFIVCALINGVYSGTWDVLMDFSLTPKFQRKLRTVLVYPAWWYWIAMFFDFTLRQNWVLYVIFWRHKSQSAYISFIVALLEITRRVVWVGFRVENEHAANIMRCRAFKDLNLPYDDVIKPISDLENDGDDVSVGRRLSDNSGLVRRTPRLKNQKAQDNKTPDEEVIYNEH